MDNLHETALGFGSNLGDGRRNIAAALQLLVGGGVEIAMVSSLYATSPVGGPPGQPDFFNAAALARTALSPHDLLVLCKSIERKLGRTDQPVKWGPRTVDIDILIYGSAEVRDDDLVIPHPELGNRLFVLVPLLEVAPDDMVLPDGGLVREFAESRIQVLQSSGQKIEKIIFGAD
jgi:2-amino-4-hydroxy-6-hydroxymethyldihydropteridine diphosphokinase